MKILVVDDHPLVRKGLSSTLSFEENIEKIDEASNVAEAMNFLTKEKFDLAIIDLNLGREDGLEVVSKGRKKELETKFIILTSSIKRDDFLRAKGMGVDGYILKEAFAEDILYALRVVARGRKFFDSEVLKYEESEMGDNNLIDLTSREKDVFKELGNGLSNMQIAERLYISENTVKKHVSNILSKLELTHRTQVALLANTSMGI